MKKIWNFILKYRVIIVLVLLAIFLTFMFIAIKSYMYPTDVKSVYGNRLDGIEKVPFTDDEIKKLVNKIKEDENFTDASISIKGKIVNIHIKVTNKDNTKDKMKEKCNDILKEFSEEKIAFYDFEFFITNEDGNYKMIGYKNKKRKEISYVSDEIVKAVKEDEQEQE